VKTPLGSQFKTGEKNPESGVYLFVKHTDGTINHTTAETLIPLTKDETFPPCKSCNKAAIWQLKSYA
jgi:hypothetical protein